MRKGLLVPAMLLLAGNGVAAQHNVDPETVSKNFYSWYLTALSKDESPADEQDPELKHYVTPQLLNKITLLIKGPEGMDDDFFLQDQDYSDSWVDHVRVGSFTLNGSTASGDVMLGNDPADLQHLLVTLHRDAAGWKIDDVEKEYR